MEDATSQALNWIFDVRVEFNIKVGKNSAAVLVKNKEGTQDFRYLGPCLYDRQDGTHGEKGCISSRVEFPLI